MKSFVIQIILIFALQYSICMSQISGSSEKTILEGLDDIYNLKFDDAGNKFKQIQKSKPDSPEAYFYESLLYFYKALPSRDENMFDKYIDLSGKVIEIAENKLDDNENDIDALYYKGLTHSYRSLIMLTLNKSLLEAASNGNDGYRILSSIIEKKPEYYDAYMGLGLYKIAISFVPEKFQWLLSLIGFKGNLNDGISLLKTSKDKGKFTKTDSKVFLTLFSLREKEDDDDVSLNFSKELSQQYPSSPVFKVFYSGFLLQKGDPLSAIEAANAALILNTNSMQSEIKKSAAALLGTAYFRLNDFSKAVQYLEEYMNYANSEDRNNVYLFTLGTAYELSDDRIKAMDKYRKVRKNFINERDGELDKYFYRLAQERINSPMTEFDRMLVKGLNNREAGKPNEAIKVYEEMQKMKLQEKNNSDDDKTKFYYDYGLANVYTRNDDKALECFKVCIKLNPEREIGLVPHAYFEMGKIFDRKGDKEKSEEMFEKIFEYDNFNFESFLEMRLANYRNR